MVLLYPCHPSSKAAQLHAQKGDHFNPWFLHREKGEHVNENPASPALQDTAKETHFFLILSGILRCATCLPDGAAGRLAARTLRGHQRNANSTKSFADSIRSHTMSQQECLVHGSPNWPMDIPNALHALPTNPLTGCRAACACPQDRDSKLQQMASKHVQITGLTLQDWEKANKLEQLAASQEKQEGSYKHLAWYTRLRQITQS